MCRSHSTLHSGLHEQYFMEFQLPGRDTVGTVGRRGCLLIIFLWNLEPHLPWPLLHQIGGSAVFTVLWVPLSYRVARPGFSDSHDLPSHGLQFSTGLSRSVSGQRSSAAIYPAQCVNYRRLFWYCPVISRPGDTAPHCSTLSVSHVTTLLIVQSRPVLGTRGPAYRHVSNVW